MLSEFEKFRYHEIEKGILKGEKNFSPCAYGASLVRKGGTAKRNAGETLGFPH
jgi:hypothetical protein